MNDKDFSQEYAGIPEELRSLMPKPIVREVPQSQSAYNYWEAPGPKTAQKPVEEGKMVIFYQLHAKLVDPESRLPEKSRQIICYTLACGHNTGTFDCYTERLTCTREQFDLILSMLKDEEHAEAQHKLSGVIKHGEIECDITSVAALSKAISYVYKHTDDESLHVFLKGVSKLLADLAHESGMRVVGRLI